MTENYFEERIKARQRMAASLKETIQRHHRVVNRLEPHLGCVVCHGPLSDEGVCPTCDPEQFDGPRGRSG